MQNESKKTPPGKAERYREIVATLARHGIGVVGQQLGKGEEEQEHLRAGHLRQACEELGTTFIKLGQMLSTRADILPETYRIELMKLQDSVPPVGDALIENVIVEELGASPELLFARFDRTALASASIGQVHAVTLNDGRGAVVKIQKPGVRELVETDLEILDDLAKSWSQRFPVLAEYDVERLAQDFADSLRAELDYRKEAANVALFRKMFEDEPGFALPECIAEWCTPRVLALTRLQGSKPADVADLGERRRNILARRIARFILEPAFEHGIFHADPHAGNFLIQENGTLAVVDFGMVARLTPDARRKVADVFVAIDRRDAQRLGDRLIEMTSPAHPIDRATFTAELDRLLEQSVDVSLERIDFGRAIGSLLELVRRHRLRLPGSLAQLFKALIMCEGLLELIEPGASLSDYLKPMVSKLVQRRFTGGEWRERLQDTAADAAELSIELPRRIDRVLGEVERGNLRVWTRLEDVDKLAGRFEHSIERANATMLAAACIVAIAIVMNFYHPQGFQQWIGVVFWIAVAAALVHVVRTLIALRK